MAHSRLASIASAFVLFVLHSSAGTAAQVSNQQLFDAIGLRAGMTVCEIGAGAGDLAFAAAKAVGVEGRVVATELEQWLKTLRVRTEYSGLSNITVVAGSPTATNLPDASCDAAFMKDVYHHFTEPAAMNASLLKALKPGARLGIVDFTPPPGSDAPTPADRGKDGMHGIRPPTLVRELTDAGFEIVPRDYGTERWFLVIAERRK